MIEPEQTTPQRPPGCSRPFKACVIAAAVIVLAFAGLLVYVIRMPAMHGLVKCESNMMAIGQALGRYRDVNGAYPPDLRALQKDYLKDPSVLRCPLDASRGDQPSYTYHRPGPDARDDFVMLECDLHKLRPDVPVSKLLLLKDGTVKTLAPTFSDVLREQARQQKRGR